MARTGTELLKMVSLLVFMEKLKKNFKKRKKIKRPVCSREVLRGGLGCPGAMKCSTGHQDEVILAKEKTGIQLKQDAIKKENRKVKDCKALLQRRPRSGWLWKTPRHYQQGSRLKSNPVGTRKTEDASGASSCSTASAQPLTAAAGTEASPEAFVYFNFFSSLQTFQP